MAVKMRRHRRRVLARIASTEIMVINVPSPVAFSRRLGPREELFVVEALRTAVKQRAHSKSEYKRRVAMGDPNVLPPEAA